jgi:hypothetical protein
LFVMRSRSTPADEVPKHPMTSTMIQRSNGGRPALAGVLTGETPPGTQPPAPSGVAPNSAHAADEVC